VVFITEFISQEEKREKKKKKFVFFLGIFVILLFFGEIQRPTLSPLWYSVGKMLPECP